MIGQEEELIIDENLEDEDDFPNNNFPAYVNSLSNNNCSNEQILRFDAGRFVDLKIKPSSFLQNEKGLFADCDIPKGL